MRKKTDFPPLCFNSPFADFARDYIEQHRAVGKKYSVDAVYLEQFDKYCVDSNIAYISQVPELFDKWRQKRPHETDTSHNIRNRILRKFFKFLHNYDIAVPSTFHPLPRPDKSFVPYIFTRDEIVKLLTAATKVKRNDHNPLAPLTIPLIFKTLYCCGLRVSEVLQLRNEDVDLQRGTLQILDSKGGKDRLVPLSESLLQLFLEYSANEKIRAFGSEYFFPSVDGGRYASCTMYGRFREFLWKAGIPHGGRGSGPRLHDLRHTFAVHTLDNWARQGKDLYVCLPILSVYLGHKNLLSTQKYLRLTPESYHSMLNSYGEHFGDVFPEVRYEEV